MPKTLGAEGEERACNWMLARGWRVLERNFRRRGGEIDIVAMDGATLVMAEVKTRSRIHEKFGGGEQAVNSKKRRRIIKTTHKWMRAHSFFGQKRYDIIEWTVSEGRWRLRWVPGAFRQWHQSDDWRYYDDRFQYNDASGRFEFRDE